MPEAIAIKLRNGHALDDREFDLLFPDWARRLSTIHWTPIEAARRAADLLVDRPGLRVLDVGAGVGKFGIVGALATQGRFFGIEQRFQFVRAGREVAAALGVHRFKLWHGNMMEIDWRSFGGLYLFNPFAENLGNGMTPLDTTIDVEPSLFMRYVEFVEQALAGAAAGTRVVTYHGFGGDMPPAYRLEWQEECLTDRLELWVHGG